MGTRQILLFCAGAFSILIGSVQALVENFTISFPTAANGTTTVINTTFSSESGATLYAVIIVFTLAIIALLFYQAFLKKK